MRDWKGEELRGNDEKRNGRAEFSSNETVPERSLNRLEQSVIAPNTDETASFMPSSPTPTVDKCAEGVDNPPSTWEEALREGARRRAAESLLWAERERRTWWDRGSSGGVGGLDGAE